MNSAGNAVTLAGGPWALLSHDLLQTLFDIAVGSMDFGSGMLDHEEVLVLRKVATLLGVDPMMAATPDNFRASFAHDYADPTTYRHVTIWDLPKPTYVEFEVCGVCRRRKEHPVHHGQSITEPAPFDY